MEKIIECKDLKKNYGRNIALDGLDFNVYEDDIYGLVGENGAGKSTLLKILAGHILKSEGSCSVLGTNIESSFEYRRDCGFLIENPSFYSYLTGMENLKYQASLRKFKVDDEIIELTKIFKIDGALNKKVKGYSTGMRQRLGIVAAMMNRPKILILDEPINGLDPSGIIDLRNFLLKINKEWGTTIIISSHILNELSQIANRVGIIKKGKMIEEITLDDLKEKNEKFIRIIAADSKDVSKIVNVLEENLKINDYKVLPNNIIEVYDIVDIFIIQKSLAEKDIYLRSASIVENTLEEYYMNLMGGLK
ncbi:ABC-2 type transport system ATP-binding protein [Anaerosphaera aminiphila DSM 21120]|uniref:ABC-2 type transport system ATP-binding protein n=1 Tax=Anaerosphaera aminiphila DSM 21120 TaxID=1120995 RepID=A0A1M5NS40_9FIRM|nr:ABC transporter ATP-binding protein [Anaerosphaera aminiphila]SHG92288.1 ABC-2 type transport system ATP-binding protein [Anaerosphaera aminiphila DSM 21120]